MKHQILVTVGSSDITVVPSELTMTSLDEVRWEATNGRTFSVVFDGNGPFAQPQLGYSLAATSQRPTIGGHFKYSVVSDENPKVALDPIIIVEEPPSQTKP